MSQILINDYLKQLDLIRRVSGRPKDPTIRRKFDSYRFADYKENQAY